jgi:hypothetical protein
MFNRMISSGLAAAVAIIAGRTFFAAPGSRRSVRRRRGARRRGSKPTLCPQGRANPGRPFCPTEG